ARRARRYPAAHDGPVRSAVLSVVSIFDGFSPAPDGWRGAREIPFPRALLPAAAAFGDRAEVPRGLRDAGRPAKGHHSRGGGAETQRGLVLDAETWRRGENHLKVLSFSASLRLRVRF